MWALKATYYRVYVPTLYNYYRKGLSHTPFITIISDKDLS